MQNTANYNLKKPEVTDYVQISDLNENADIIDAKLKENEEAIVSHQNDFATFKSDYAYQTPVINGTQIQIQQQSGSNRLYFKLDNVLSGGDINISLDGGTTDLPLLDIEGQPVTEISKGFVEVIKDAVNFTLRPSGGGSNIKSIQKGTRTISSLTYMSDVPIESVDMDKSIAIVSFRSSAAVSAELYVSVDFLDSTTIRLEKGKGDVSTTVYWQVIEFEDAVSVQRGSLDLNSTSTTRVAINEVDLTSSALIHSFHSHETSALLPLSVHSTFTNSSEISFRTNTNALNTSVYWQVIEFK